MTDISHFLNTVSDYYARHGRYDLLWRQPHGKAYDPYRIMVSEIMLQQTQVVRVTSKYQEFLSRFPDISSLARSSLGEVLQVWQGLGYNRRAKFLWQAAQAVCLQHGGVVPRSTEQLVALPGIGSNTAGAIMAYAWDEPAVFIETNVRTVYIHHFFADSDAITDAEIRPLIIESLLHIQDFGLTPREFYWALMDYGTFLKKTVGNLSRRSKQYAKQSAFEGSERQIRGAVLRLLAVGPCASDTMRQRIADQRLPKVLQDLEQESLIVQRDGVYTLP